MEKSLCCSHYMTCCLIIGGLVFILSMNRALYYPKDASQTGAHCESETNQIEVQQFLAFPDQSNQVPRTSGCECVPLDQQYHGSCLTSHAKLVTHWQYRKHCYLTPARHVIFAPSAAR